MSRQRYTITTDATHEIEAMLARFERERAAGPVDLRDYLPDRDDPAFPAVVTELCRIDLEHRFDAGQMPPASEYVDAFREVFDQQAYRAQLAFEEFRLRRWAGEDIAAVEIAGRYDVDGSRWPKLKLGSGEQSKSESTSRRFEKEELKIPIVRYPRVGDAFCGYPLVDRLGEGAFSRVFLARQPDLASRPVVLKVTPLATDESDRLARLQHTNIIPVYSVHRDGDLSSICMPFLGATTLADLSRSGARWASLHGPAEEIVSTILDRRRSTIGMLAPLASEPARTPPRQAEDERDPRGAPEFDGLAQYSQLGYVDALLALVAGAVEGLAHAHQRGIVHRDLKPANILVSDDGNPVLLDFNLAVADHEPKTRIVGGTLPYMSPQQLAALETGEAANASDDVFSIGVILYELLTGRLPFACPRSEDALDLGRVIADRRKSPVSIRVLNRRVSPGLESIIIKCVSPERIDRYQNATTLLDDIDCHRRHLPLRHASERSLRERVAKWSARHPRLSSASSVATLALAALMLCGFLIFRRGERIAMLDAEAKLQSFQADLPSTITALSTPGREPEVLEEGLRESSRLLASWLPTDDGNAVLQSGRLETASQQTLRRQLARLAYLMADAEADLGLRRDIESDRVGPRREQALRWNAISGDLDRRVLPLAEQQRKRIAAKFEGREIDDVTVEQLDLEQLDLRTLAAAEGGNASSLRELARTQLRQQPSNVSLWFYSAIANASLGEWERAIAELNVCDALQPRSLATLFNRGLCELGIGDAELARADFSRCLQLKPGMITARFNRAVAAEQMGDLDAALKDLNQIVQTGRATTRMMLMRARLHQQVGNATAASTDRRKAMTIPPRDVNDWVARGVSRLEDSPREALDDFLAALRIQPRDFDALQNSAHVYAERFDDPQHAIEMLDRLVAARPSEASPVASRGILHARLSHFDTAIADAKTAAKLRPGPREQLQIAGVYARASGDPLDGEKMTSEDAQDQALLWLGRALREDPALASTASEDGDLANLRGNANFRRLVGSAMSLTRG